MSTGAEWTARAEAVSVAPRSWRYYQRVFDIQPGEQVLDLGAGNTLYAPDGFIRASYSAHLQTPEVGVNVACLFQQLPFRDERFDRAIAGYALIHVGEGAVESLDEILRTVRPGGNVQIFPDFLLKMDRETKAFMKEHGLEARRPKMSLTRKVVSASALAITAISGNVVRQSIENGAAAPAAIGSALLTLSGAALAATMYDVRKTLIIPRTEAMSDPEYRHDFSQELIARRKFTSTRS